MDDDITSPDTNAISIPQSSVNGINKTSPKVSVISQGGQTKPEGQQPLRSVNAIRHRFKRLTSFNGFLNDRKPRSKDSY